MEKFPTNAAFLTIDPGLHNCAIAAWDEKKRLIYADNLPTAQVVLLVDKHAPPAKLWVEVPVLYPKKRTTHYQVERLLELANALKRAADGVGVVPSAWKAQIPKTIHKSRILGNLDPVEFRVIVSPADHNTIDAIGIGLWALGRSGRGGV